MAARPGIAKKPVHQNYCVLCVLSTHTGDGPWAREARSLLPQMEAQIGVPKALAPRRGFTRCTLVTPATVGLWAREERFCLPGMTGRHGEHQTHRRVILRRGTTRLFFSACLRPCRHFGLR